MQQEIRLATFNVCNLAPPGMQFYDSLPPYTPQQYAEKVQWLAQQLDRLDADVIGFQEIFSQSALKDVLNASRRYRHAHHAGFEPLPDPHTGRLTPSVALATRLPLIDASSHAAFPRGLRVPLPDMPEMAVCFTRPVLHAQILLAPALPINVLVVHLKSPLPDYRNAEQETDSYQHGIAALRSLIRRAAEALGLRYLAIEQMRNKRMPLIVMGDFNDVATSATTQLVMGSGRAAQEDFEERLFDSAQLQQHRAPHSDSYTYQFQDRRETIDHILVSQEFHPASRHAIGEVVEVEYVNEHLALRLPQASDHGIVLARIKLHGMDANAAGQQDKPTAAQAPISLK